MLICFGYLFVLIDSKFYLYEYVCIFISVDRLSFLSTYMFWIFTNVDMFWISINLICFGYLSA
jgi:hypothetical protein